MITFTLAAPAAMQPNVRIYAVGDIHGCLDKLNALYEQIIEDLNARPVADARLLYLGDYIDRGPNSAGIIECLSTRQPVSGLRVTNLMGNHEQMMLSVLATGSDEMAAIWCRNGGDAALRSWGVDPATPLRTWGEQIPPTHLNWLRSLKLHEQIGPYFFVHAGVRPGVALTEQKRDDLLWIREPFLSYSGDLGPIIVHGHTPSSYPVLRTNRIGIDTGAVLGGMLSCVVLQENRLGLLSCW